MNLYVYFQGGLGNQMFQYAAGVSALKEYPQFTNLKLDTSFYKGQEVKVVKNGITGRNYDLDVFNLTYTDVEESPDGAVMLKGWFQHIKEFENIEDQIRKEFTFKVNFQDSTKKMESDILSKEMPVSIHVRRGDYLYNQNCLNFHGVLDKEYYDKSIEMMQKKYSNLDYYVFSEDIEWCKDNILVGYKNVTYVGKEYNDYKDTGHLYLMTKCKAHIIANSSFSWWGAWLANSKFVVGPKVWNKGGDGTENIMKDLENWVQV